MALVNDSPDLIRRYIAEHPEGDIVFRCNAVNKGWAQNYVDLNIHRQRALPPRHMRRQLGDGGDDPQGASPARRGRHRHSLLHSCQPKEALSRHVVSSTYTLIVNLLSGNSLHYYNGLPVHRRYNVMRWHSDTRGFGFQADILCLLLGQGATYKEVALTAVEQRPGASSALTWRNLLSVTHIPIRHRAAANY